MVASLFPHHVNALQRNNQAPPSIHIAFGWSLQSHCAYDYNISFALVNKGLTLCGSLLNSKDNDLLIRFFSIDKLAFTTLGIPTVGIEIRRVTS